MTPLERIADAALSGDALATRAHLLEWMATSPRVADAPPPSPATAPATRSLAAALAELFAARWDQVPPGWAAEIGPALAPTYLVGSPRMSRTRTLCEAEAPPPLRRRSFYAPANYLELV